MLHRPRGRAHRDVGRFDKWSATYEQHWLQKRLFDPAHEVIVDSALRFRPAAGAILDVGSGTGRLLRRLRSAFPEATLRGIDAAAGMVDAARQTSTPRVEYLQGRAEDLPFADGTFDLVTTTMSFHHWRDQRAGLREVHRVLRPGGVFLLNDMVLQWWMQPFAVLVRARHRTHTLQEFRALLRESDFRTLRAVPLAGMSHAVYVMAGRKP